MSDEKPITCDCCPAAAAYYVAIERAVDEVESECAAAWLCAAHYALHVQTFLGICHVAIESKPDDDLVSGAFQIDVSRADDDESELGRWFLCADHGQALWSVAK